MNSSVLKDFGGGFVDIYRNLSNYPKVNNQPGGIQSTYMSTQFANNMHRGSLSLSQNLDNEDLSNSLKITMQSIKSILVSIMDLPVQFVSEAKDILQNLMNELSTSHWNLSSILSSFGNLFAAVLKNIGTAAVETSIVLVLALVRFYDTILRTRFNLPFVTSFYENLILKGQGKACLYDIFALIAAFPVSVYTKATTGQPLFKEQEAVVLINSSPDDYVNALTDYGMLKANQDRKTLRNMYRLSVSYILGAGYSTAQFFSSLATFVENVWLMYGVRVSFEFMGILCNYPWSWYTETDTPVSVNIRFLGWFSQFW